MALTVNQLGKYPSIFNQYLSEIRDAHIQKDRLRFRQNVRRMGTVLGYEISKKLAYQETEVVTPLGNAFVPNLITQPVLATVLRAGLPLHDGLLSVFDKADNGFVSAYRKHHKDNEFEIEVEYVSCSSLVGKTLILSDTMVATGSSMLLSYKALVDEYGIPEHTHFVSLIASAEGVQFLEENLERDCTLWVGAIDDELTAQSYIVPGLGDAGDLAFGQKL